MAQGARAANVIAFARRKEDDVLITIVPRLPLALLPPGDAILIPPSAWGDTKLPGVGGRLRDVISGRILTVPDGALPVREALADFPVALLVAP